MNKLILVLAVAMVMSCGENKKEEPLDMQTETTVEETTPVEAEVPAVAEITISGNDQMKYDKSEIRVKAGQKVKLTLKHVGKMPKVAMGHNWVLLTQDADMTAVGNAAATSTATDHIPAEFKDKIIVHTPMIGGGETTTIGFDAPAAGTYTFMCTFPGHYASMNGKFIVE